jgi:hypothetical protein
MNNKITQRQITSRLEEHGFEYSILELQNGVSIVVSKYGGRIFGPFLPPAVVPGGESLFWTNNAFAQADSFQDFLESGDWNLGGERIWIAPEIQYNVHDRTDYWNTYNLPGQVDPGRYSMDQVRSGQWQLAQDMTLEAYNLGSGTKELHLGRLIHQVADPLRYLNNYQELMDGVIFAGYEQVLSISESKRDDLKTEVWNLLQLNAGGLLFIPATRRLSYTDHYKPIDDSHQTVYPDHVRLRITGDRQYKVGYKAAHVFGRIGYYNQVDDGPAYLIVRNFFNNPSMPYAEEPADIPGACGHSIHVYNDDGNLGGFGEMECNCQTIGGETNRSSSTDQVVLWIYTGAPGPLKEIGLHLLGIEI